MNEKTKDVLTGIVMFLPILFITYIVGRQIERDMKEQLIHTNTIHGGVL